MRRHLRVQFQLDWVIRADGREYSDYLGFSQPGLNRQTEVKA